VRVLRHLDFSRLPSTTALAAGCCSLCVSPSDQPLTQEPPSQFFLAAPGIPSCATRRTLAPGRGSRVPSREDLRAQRRCLIHHLHETSLVPILSLRVLRTATLSRVAKGSGLKRSARGCVLPSSVLEVRAILLSPYCAELASLKLQRFRFSLAFTACCGSLFLSEPGQPVFLKPPSSSSRLRRRSHRA